MRLPVLPLTALAVALTVSAAPDPLRVIRAGPSNPAAPTDTVLITFDRPVAGSVDNTVPASSIVRIDPAISGRVEWRDPVTLRVVPDAPLPRGRTYQVVVSREFRAMDGSSLEQPYRFVFRVRGPTLLGGSPVSGEDTARLIARTPRLTLFYDAPVADADIAARARLLPAATCRDSAGRRAQAVLLRPLSDAERAADTADSANTPGRSGARARPTDDTQGSLPYAVRLVAERQLPANCDATLVAPTELGTGKVERTPVLADANWHFRTHGAFQIDSARCAGAPWCPQGPVLLHFSTPVRGAELARVLNIAPRTSLFLDTARTAATWQLSGTLVPRTAYALILARGLRDVFGQSLGGNPSVGIRTTGYAPDVQAPSGRLTVERTGFRTLAVRTMNIDTLLVERLSVPDSATARLLAGGEWTWREFWLAQPRGITRQRIAITRTPDRGRIVSVAMPAGTAAQPAPALQLVRVRDARGAEQANDADEWFRLALVQVTDLGVHAKIGDNSGLVWVTDGRDGRVQSGARVTLHDQSGKVLASSATNADGIALLSDFSWQRPQPADSTNGFETRLEEGFVTVALGNDRVLLPVRDHDPDLAPWRFGIRSAYGTDRATIAAALFTERDIYRPGENVYAKAIVRGGPLGALRAPAPADTVRWIRRDTDYRIIDSAQAQLSEFGTSNIALPIPADAKTGFYQMALEWRHRQRWEPIAYVSYRIAEYRPPEFLVDMTNEREPARPGDSLGVRVAARYLFGGPLAGAVVRWSLTEQPVAAGELAIPGTDGWMVGDSDYGWQPREPYLGTRFVTSGTDSLNADGVIALAVRTPDNQTGQPRRVTLTTNVIDVNRQQVGSRTSSVVHPAAFYIAARPEGDQWFWTANRARAISLAARRATGERVSGVRIDGLLVRREWHRVQRIRNGIAEQVGEWVADTVSRCTVTVGAIDGTCNVTPTKGGVHSLIFTARDNDGRTTVTAFTRWVAGPEWVPWSDDNQLKLDVIADKERYAPGDTATLMFASPFTNAEALITVEREGVLEHRRQRLTSGTTTLRLPITEAHAPNIFVSMLVARGRVQAPDATGDPGRPTIRVGFAELRVTPEVKRLRVTVAPDRAQYAPGDSARVQVAVRDAAGNGQRSEVTLWAVDQGVLSLTGFATPDPVDLLYSPRGLGLTLASTHANVAPQLPEGEKATREPGGGGGGSDDDVLRSRFRTTAFFLGSVVTDANGNATATATLPDNLTTFRVMAVALTTGDRFGSGDTTLLVTRPLIARAALPRFVRVGDVVDAGTTINRREGASGTVRVDAKATGATLVGSARQNVRVELDRAVDVRFPFRVPAGNSVNFRFDVSGGGDRDAVQVSIPVRENSRPVQASASAMIATQGTLTLPWLDNADLQRSRLSLSLGASPLALVRAAAERARVYLWACTEQIASTALPLIALMASDQAPPSALSDVARVVRTLEQRQRSDGGIGYWSSGDWTTPWLTAHAALVLVEARAVGVPVDSSTLQRVADYLRQAVGEPEAAYAPSRGLTPVSRRFALPHVILGEYVAAAEALRALGQPNVAVENNLVRQAARLSLADRARLARIIAERGDVPTARTLLEGLWARVRQDGRRALLTDTLDRNGFYFASPLRVSGELLRATLLVDADHALIAPLIETVVAQARGGSGWFGVTPDMATAVRALRVVEQRQQQATQRGARVMLDGRTVFTIAPGTVLRDTSLALRELLGGNSAPRGDSVSLTITPLTDGAALFASATLITVANAPPTRPLERGITVERWTENAESGATILSAPAGALVRVKVRVTVPAERSFVAIEDPLPAGLEPVDLSLRTSVLAASAPNAGNTPVGTRGAYFYGEEDDPMTSWSSGRWDAGFWTPFEHRELRDDRVIWSATTVYPGQFTLSYLARATTPGRFVRPPAFAEEMYDPSVFGRTEGSVFTITAPRP